MSGKEIVTVVYDERSRNWSSDPDINRIFLRTQNSYFADLLKTRGHLFLNEVYDALGLPRTSEGQLKGWIQPGNTIKLWTERRIEGEDVVRIMFEIDGVIYDKIES